MSQHGPVAACVSGISTLGKISQRVLLPKLAGSSMLADEVVRVNLLLLILIVCGCSLFFGMSSFQPWKPEHKGFVAALVCILGCLCACGDLFITRPDTRLPQSRAGGQEQCWIRSLEHLGRSRMLKKLKNADKVKRGPTDRPTNGRT